MPPWTHPSPQSTSQMTSQSIGSAISAQLTAELLLSLWVHVFSHSIATSSAECSRCSPLQLGLWAAVDNMWHRLAFATRALVGFCKAHFFRQRSGLGWSGSDLGVPSSVQVGRILVAGVRSPAECPYTLQRAPLSTRNGPFACVDVNPIWPGSMSSPEYATQTASRSVQDPRSWQTDRPCYSL